MAASTSSDAGDRDRYRKGRCQLNAVIPIPIYPIALLALAAISGIVKVVKRGQAATAHVDTFAFKPELSAIHRQVTPALVSATAIADVASSMPGVRVEQQATSTVFLSLVAAGGLWIRIISESRGDQTIVTIEGRRKVNGLTTLTRADDALFGFEKGLRDRLAQSGHKVVNINERAQAMTPGTSLTTTAPAPAPPPDWAAPPNQPIASPTADEDRSSQWW